MPNNTRVVYRYRAAFVVAVLSTPNRFYVYQLVAQKAQLIGATESADTRAAFKLAISECRGLYHRGIGA